MTTPREDVWDYNLIVGCVRDSQIHVGMPAFQLMASGLYDKLVTLAEAKFMASSSVGGAWNGLVEATPIYGIDEYGVPFFVEGGVAVKRPEPVVESECEVVLDSEPGEVLEGEVVS